jgi:hypothetical protein
MAQETLRAGGDGHHIAFQPIAETYVMRAAAQFYRAGMRNAGVGWQRLEVHLRPTGHVSHFRSLLNQIGP